MENGRLMTLRHRLALVKGFLHTDCPIIRIGGRQGNIGYVWCFKTLPLENKTYYCQYMCGAINAGGDAWFAGNCIWIDGIIGDIRGWEEALPPYSWLPGDNNQFNSKNEAEQASKNAHALINITKNGISMCFRDTNCTDNWGAVYYLLIPVNQS